ncbi:hypothetical protein AC578_10058 [Pseudocercospora eumusae]|uniref:F-box domain-containing protein n=1 Tax=Pseudocercospora eumusae TaxID=321146 RepID=A0A139H827_9PEZI|nr:hypothetical protein AC578_10058 [Pseudocercospora eumusae]
MATRQPRSRAPHVRRAAGYAVAARVFAIPELLENILDNLSMPELFIAQHICKHFKAVVVTSSLLKRKLFLSPTKHTKSWILEKKQGDEHNGSFKKTSPDMEPTLQNQDAVYVGAKLNPLLIADDAIHRTVWFKWAFSFAHMRHRKQIVAKIRHPFWSEPLKSAGDMFMTQPPAREVYFEVGDFWYGLETQRRSILVVTNTAGIKVKDVQAALRRIRKSHEESLCFISFDGMFFPTSTEDRTGIAEYWFW